MIKNTKRQIIRDEPYGMWVLEFEDGTIAGDDEGNIMNVFIMNVNDPKQSSAAKQALLDAAKSYGMEGGRPIFWNGRRPIDDEELEHQLARQKMGLTPDQLDIGAYLDDERELRNIR